MAAPTGSILNTHSTRVQEILNKSLGVFLPTFDPVWQDTIVSNQGVGAVGDLGRDWMITKLFSGGLAGVIEPGGPGSDFALYGDPSNTTLGAKLFTQGLSRAFPDATQGMNQLTYRLGIPMRSMVTNLMITVGEKQADAHDALIGQVIAPKLEGFARYLAQTLCNYWYTSQNTYYSLAAIAGTNSASGGFYTNQDSGATLMVDLTAGNYAIDRFMVGMRVQFYDSSGTTLRTTTSLGANTVFVVSAVDELSGKVYFKPINGASDVHSSLNGVLVATDIIVMANSKGNSTTPFSASPYFTGIAGINSWLKFGDTNGSTDNANNNLLGDERIGSAYGFNHNINVNVHPEFKSMGYNMSGQPITEHVLRKILRRFHAAKGKYGHFIDCLIASDGVWLAYESQKIGRQFLDRTGRLSSVKNEGSQEGFEFEFDGRSYMGYTSNYVESGTTYGIRKANNWKRYSPPDPQGASRFDRTPGWNPFKFVGGILTGTGSNQLPILAVQNNRTFVTEGVQMPGWLRMQLVPEQVTGLKITNCAEDRVYGVGVASL